MALPGKFNQLGDDAAMLLKQQMGGAKPSAYGAKAKSSAADDIATDDMLLNLAESPTGMLGGVGMATMLAPPVAGWGGAALTAMGGWLGLRSMEKGGNAIQDLVEKGHTTKIGAVVPGLERVAQIVTRPFSGALDRLSKIGGFNEKRVAKAIKQAKAAYEGIPPLMDKYKAEMAGVTNQDVLGKMKALSEAVSAPNVGHLNAEGIEDAHNALKKTLKQTKTKISSTYGTLAETAGAAAHHHARAEGWKDVRAVVAEKAPKALARTSVLESISNTAFLGMEALGLLKLIPSIKKDVDSLRQVQADLTGKDVKNVSSLQVLTGDVSPLVARERGTLLKREGVQLVAHAGSFLMMLKQAFRGRVGFFTFAAPQVISGLAESAIGDSVVPAYIEFRKAHAAAKKAGTSLSVEDYARFLSAVVPQFSTLGVHNPITLKVAENLQAQQADAASIVKNTDALVKMGDEAVTSIKSQTPVAQAPQPIDTHWQETVAKGKQPNAYQQLGINTQRIAQEVTAMQQGGGVTPAPTK